MHPVSLSGDGHARAIAATNGNVTPSGVLALQRLVGNKATTAVVQREDEEDGNAEALKAQQARSAPGAARGRKALRGLVDESRAYNKGMLMSIHPERRRGTRSDQDPNKTTTAGGAYIASQVNSKEKIGDSKAYTSQNEREGHLGEFLKGAHAFVSNEAYLKIRGEHLTENNFNAWGAGSNFVAPLSDADSLVEKASGESGKGLFDLEESLGITPMMWVNQCRSTDFGIWRFKILRPDALNLRIPSGNETNAYGSWVDRQGAAHRGEWRPGGRTLGGAKEAVIDQVGAGKFGEKGEKAGEATRNKLEELEQDGTLRIELDKTMSGNTKRALLAKSQAD
jgi:hypothetical protein